MADILPGPLRRARRPLRLKGRKELMYAGSGVRVGISEAPRFLSSDF